jgi:hypothetical protein
VTTIGGIGERIVAAALVVAASVVGAGVGLPAAARAHNPDTSYARFQIGRESVISTFTYDITSLVRIFPQLDADGDARLSEGELQAATPRIAEFLRRTVALQIDGAEAGLGDSRTPKWPAAPGASIPEKDYHAANSLVAFEFVKRLRRPPAEVRYEFAFFDTLGLRHTVLGVFEHEGAKDEVLFTPFEADYLYKTKYAAERPVATATASGAGGGTAGGTQGGIAGAAREAEAAPSRTTESGSRRSSDQTALDRLRLFFWFGVTHIVEGYDHILFLLSLIVVSKFRELVKIVTSFTVAHSITLAVATLEWVRIPSEVVESAIAATIVYTAAENFWIRDTSGRWKLTFVFGLIHGFGFAGILGGLNLPAEGFVRSLLAFNLGVEAGQLAIVAVLALPCALLARRTWGRKVQLLLSAVIALFGVGWFIDRAFGLEMMPI